MKTKRLFIALVFLGLLAAVGCGGGGGNSGSVTGTSVADGAVDGTTSTGTTSGQTTDGEVSDDSGSADAQTVISVAFDLVVTSGDSPVSGASIIIKNALGETVFSSVSDENGKLSVPVSLDSAAGPYTLTVSAEGYNSQSVTISDISELTSYTATIKLTGEYTPLKFTTTVLNSESVPVPNALVFVKDSLGNTVLLDSAGTPVLFLVSDENGQIAFDCKVLSSLENLTVTVSAVNYDSKVVAASSASEIESLLSGSVQLSRINSDALNTNSDKPSDGGFDYSTVKDLSFSVTVVDLYGSPVNGAKITLKDASGAVITSAVSQSDGVAAFAGAISKVNEYIVLSIAREGFVSSGDIKISNYLDLESVIRTISLERVQIIVPDSDGDGINDDVDPSPEDVSIPDSDGDGIPDFDYDGNVMGVDAAPYDPAIAFVSSASYTFAFEDLYPAKGDSDFNDLVVKVSFTESSGSDNKVRKIAVSAKPLAAGAGYDNKLALRLFDGSKYADYVLMESSKAVFGSDWEKFNVKKNSKYSSQAGTSLVVSFSDGVDKSSIGAMPYDVYLVPNQVSGREIHLPFAKTSYSGSVLDSDNFPWAIIVPESWAWPYEGGSIFKAYHKFENWYKSNGAQDSDWYLFPVKGQTYQIK